MPALSLLRGVGRKAWKTSQLLLGAFLFAASVASAVGLVYAVVYVHPEIEPLDFSSKDPTSVEFLLSNPSLVPFTHVSFNCDVESLRSKTEGWNVIIEPDPDMNLPPGASIGFGDKSKGQQVRVFGGKPTVTELLPGHPVHATCNATQSGITELIVSAKAEFCARPMPHTWLLRRIAWCDHGAWTYKLTRDSEGKAHFFPQVTIGSAN